MAEILSLKPKPDDDDDEEAKTRGATAEDQTLMGDEEKEAVSSALLEPSTLQWQEPKERGKKGEPRSVFSEKRGEGEKRKMVGDPGSVESVCLLSGQESRTESERELGGGKGTEEGWMDTGKDRKKEMEDGENADHFEKEAGAINVMPDKAAQVFSPSVTVLKMSEQPGFLGENKSHWAEDTEKIPFIGRQGTPPNEYYQDWRSRDETLKCGCCGGRRDALKLGVSVFTAALIFPLLVWGGYVFLPFDAPLLHSAPLRLIYTLRCSVFAVVPIVLGMLVQGVSRLWTCSVRPMCEAEVESREVGVHRRFVVDSLSLFLLYFLQLAVMASYLSQELLKLVPLLTIVFAFGRLIYWLAVVLGSSVRGVGFGFSFLPMLAMLVANFYFIFMLDSGGSIFSMEAPPTPEPPPPPRQRFWG